MISYRELAMRALGKPLRDPASSPRPVAHRVTALALTAAMASALASPAFAGWTINMSEVEGNVTIKKDNSGNTTIEVDDNGTTIKVGSSTSGIKGVTKDSNDDNKITVTGDNTKTSSGNQVTLEAPDDNTRQPVVDEGTSGQTDEEEGGSADPAPTPVVTWPDPASGSTGSSEPTGSTPEGTDDPANEMVYPDTGDDTDGGSTGYTTLEGTDGTQQPVVDEETSGQEPVAGGQTGSAEGGTTEETADPEGGVTGETGTEGGQPAENVPATLEAPTGGMALAGVSRDQEEDDNEPETYLGKAAKVLTTATSNAINKILKIINNSSEELDVTLNNATIDATGTGDSALTVEGKGSTKLTLEGESTLTGGTGRSGLYQTSSSTLTITGEANAKLTATGGDGATDTSGGNGIYSYGDLTIEGGTVTATGGKGGNDNKDTKGGTGIYSYHALTIEGSAVVSAQGGDGINGGYGILSDSTVNIGGSAVIKKAQGGNSTDENGTGGAGISGGSVSISGGTVENATGGEGSQYGGNGIYGSSSVTISGGTIGKWDNAGNVDANTGAKGRNGIRSGGALTISGDSKVKATGNSGSGISGGTVEITGGTVDAEGNGSDSYGIYGKNVSVKNNADIKNAKGGDAGIYARSSLSITGGTIGEWNNGNATDGTGAVGARGIYSEGSITISGGKVKATGNSGSGIHMASTADGNTLTISGGTVDATGTGDNISGIYSNTNVTIGGGDTTATVNAKGNGNGSYGINGQNVYVKNNANIEHAEGEKAGIYARSSLSITGGTIEKAKGILAGISGSNVEITGGTVNAESTGKKSNGIYSSNDLTIGGGDNTATVNAKSSGQLSLGINGDNVYIKNNANIEKAEGSTAGINARSSLSITGGTIESAKGTGTDSSTDSSYGIRGSTVEISGGTIENAEGGDFGICGNNVYVKNTANIEKAEGGIAGIDAHSSLSITGGTIGKWNEDAKKFKDGTGAIGWNGIQSTGSLTISGDSKVKATGTSGSGIRSGTVEITGGTVDAEGTGDNISGIYSTGDVTIGGSDTTATVNAKGTSDSNSYGIYGKNVSVKNNADIKNAEGSSTGIYGNSKVFISGGTIENAKGNIGIGSINTVEISGGTIENAEGRLAGIYSTGDVTIGGTADIKNAEGGTAGIQGSSLTISGDSKVSVKGDYAGILSGTTSISGGTVNAEATGDDGIGIASNNLSISDGEVTASATGKGSQGIHADNATITGGSTTVNGGSNGGSGIDSGSTTIGGTANVTINMGAGGKALTKSTGQTTEDLDPDSVRANQSETLTIYDASGKQVYPVASDDDTDDTPETPVISSDSDSGTEQQPVVITPAGVSGIDFTTLQGRRVLVSADVHDTALVFITLRGGVNMHLTLGTLRQLRAQGITHITLHTLMQTTTFYLDDILSAHADAPDSTPVLLTHDGKTATLTVGGVGQ